MAYAALTPPTAIIVMDDTVKMSVVVNADKSKKDGSKRMPLRYKDRMRCEWVAGPLSLPLRERKQFQFLARTSKAM